MLSLTAEYLATSKLYPYNIGYEATPGGGYSGFQVMGMIEGFFSGLKVSIPGFFWVRKFGKYFFG